jgi:hypothetical protein
VTSRMRIDLDVGLPWSSRTGELLRAADIRCWPARRCIGTSRSTITTGAASPCDAAKIRTYMVAMRLQLYIDSTFLIKNCFFIDFYSDPDNIKPWRSIKKRGWTIAAAVSSSGNLWKPVFRQ